MATWKELMKVARDEANDFTDLVAVAPTDLDWDRQFDDGWGGSEGYDFTAWTEDRVYFPVVYDGSEWVGSVPRNPCDEASEHFGGQ